VNAGFGNEVKIESREWTKETLCHPPIGFNKEERIGPSTKTLGNFQFGAGYYEMAKPLPLYGCGRI